MSERREPHARFLWGALFMPTRQECNPFRHSGCSRALVSSCTRTHARDKQCNSDKQGQHCGETQHCDNNRNSDAPNEDASSCYRRAAIDKPSPKLTFSANQRSPCATEPQPARSPLLLWTWTLMVATLSPSGRECSVGVGDEHSPGPLIRALRIKPTSRARDTGPAIGRPSAA
jgi:hypothetical protein